MLADQVHHRGARPRLREVDGLATDLHRGVAVERGPRRGDDERLGELHHLVVVAERLVRLERRELGVVRGVDAFVAPDAPDLEHPLEAADHQPLQVQLGGDPQVQIEVERVVVRHERPSGRAAELDTQRRRLDFDEPAAVEEASDGGHGGEPDLEHATRLGIHDQVDVALPEPRVDVGEAVPLVGQRPQRLRKQLERADLHRQLTAARGHHRALDADPVAEVELVELHVRLIADRVARDEELHRVALVAHGGERQLPLPPDQHDPTRDPHGRDGLDAGLERAELAAELVERAVAVESHRVRVDPLCTELLDVGDPSRSLSGNVERGFLGRRIGHRRGS